MTRCGAGLFSLLILAAVLLPVRENWRARPRDEFPLSFYPMFCKPRGETAKVTYLIGIDRKGNARPLSYRYAASGGMNQGRKQISRHVAGGTADKLCRHVAWGVARRNDRRLSDVVAVAVVTGTFRLDDFIAGNSVPADLRLEARAAVERADP